MAEAVVLGNRVGQLEYLGFRVFRQFESPGKLLVGLPQSQALFGLIQVGLLHLCQLCL